MSALSDQLLVVAILAYLVSMLCYAVEYAFGARGAVARAATRELVGARVGGVDTASTDPDGPDGPDRSPATAPHSSLATAPHSTAISPRGTAASPRGTVAWAGRAAVGATVLGALAHLGCLVTRGLAAHRMPWGNMYEFVLTVTFVGVVAWLVLVARRPAVRHLGLYVALVLMTLLGVAGLVLYTDVAPLVPALDSYWLVIHVSAAALASGIFLVGFVTAAMYLVRAGYEQGRAGFPYSLGHRLPTAGALEPLTFRLHTLAFPVWTFAVAAGAIWAEAAWGRYWGWDPKETWAFISWVVYAGYLHARATPSVRRSTATWIAVLGWLTMLMNLFGVNLFFEGLHSYAGVE
ncbi:MAG TPA: c-type cytochrome biogenesis protein CcsB [Micromonosporaceae bacterium]|nr:c-type cytochrome biogenesis protein CcsB [Micromonosporaceae bacterium]